MNPILQVLLIAIGSSLGLLALNAITQAARKRAELPSPTVEEIPAPQASDEGIKPYPYQIETPEKEHTASYWWKRLLSGGAVLGAIFVPLQLITLCINSYVLALRMELLLGQAGSSLFTMNVFGWERDITFFDLLGCLISLIQVVAAAVYVNREKLSGPKFVAAFTWLLMVLAEVLLSVQGTLNSGGGMTMALLNGAMALGLALADSLFGLYLLELLLIPLVMAMVWTVAAPIFGGIKAVRVKLSNYAIGSKSPAAPKPPKPKRRLIARFIGSFDPLFEPLRNLDAVTSRVLRHLLRKDRNVRFQPKGELQMSKSKLTKTLALLLGVTLTLSGCGTIQKNSAPMHVFLGVDVTPTVSQNEFADYPQIAAHAVLSCLRPSDRVYQLLINSNAEGAVETFDITPGKIGLNEEARKIYESLKAIQQDRSRGVTTNLGSLLAHVKRTVNDNHQERARQTQQGKTVAPEMRYLVVLLTDGLPDGQQTIDDSAWPQNVDVWAFGIKREHETKFRQLCVEQMKIPADNLHIKLFSSWTAAVKDFGPAIDRRPNQDLLTYLLKGTKFTGGI